MYYPVISSITNDNKTIGYALVWNKIRTTRANIEQLTQLLGGNGKLYFGNDDGKFWTDLLKPVARPPVELRQLQQVAQYTRTDGEQVLATMRGVPGSRWLVLVELSSASFLKTANLFLRWVIILGIALVIAGSLGGWLMSRNITRPLRTLSKAASAIAEGDYSPVVDIDRQDELGKLAESFNIMTVRVRSAQQELEQKVQDRTKALQTAMTDISDQKENEKKKDEFISIASHELKTPLTTIKAFFQLAKREIHPEFKSFNFIGIAARQLNRMERLIEDLLDVSKINSGKMQYNLEDFDFDAMLADAIDSVQEISPKHKLVLEKSTVVIFHGDRQRIEQVIINLLDNAVKYSPNADKVLIRAELQGGKLLVTIKDFGIGIAKKHLTDLFEKFYRVDLQHRFQGLGLGLFISSEIVKRHGGTIWVTSEPGQGAAFTFQLPVKINAGSVPVAVRDVAM
jgi:signal transduction histidine kinase